MRWSADSTVTADEGQRMTPSGLITLRQAWARYRDAHLVRRGRSERTIKGYRDHVERIFAEWLDTPLREIGLDPAAVRTDVVEFEAAVARSDWIHFCISSAHSTGSSGL